ncbi:MAG: hypothetical protein FJY99_03005 [Candidatus Sericytochromatia bacterium]|nr:hypothetical protein [Candidatus Tanganyikabacteria bacterium]
MIRDDQRVTPGARPARLPREAIEAVRRPAATPTGPIATDQLTVQPVGPVAPQGTGDIRAKALEAIRQDIQVLGAHDPAGQSGRLLELLRLLPEGDPVRTEWLARLAGAAPLAGAGGGLAVTAPPPASPEGAVLLPSFDTARKPEPQPAAAPATTVTQTVMTGPTIRAGGSAPAPETLFADLDRLLAEHDAAVGKANDLGAMARAVEDLATRVAPLWSALRDALASRPDIAATVDAYAQRLKDLGVALPTEGKGGGGASAAPTPGTMAALGPLPGPVSQGNPSAPPQSPPPLQDAVPVLPLLVDPVESHNLSKADRDARDQLGKMLPKMNAGQVEQLPRQTLEAASGEQLAAMAKLLIDHWRLKDSNRDNTSYLLMVASTRGRMDTMLRTLDRQMGNKGIDKLMDSLKGEVRAQSVDAIFRDLQRTNVVGSDVLQKVAIQLNKDDVRLLLEQRGSSTSSSWFRALPPEVKTVFHDTLKRGGFGKTAKDQALLAALKAG